MAANLERVFVANGLLEAEVIKGKLESYGIPVLLQRESIAAVYGFTFGGLGEVQVLVPSDRVEEARAALADESPPT